ncbi:MAG: Co2+/Mg2+ efflux protein ApaG [Acidobacteriota bacterium]
MVEAVTRGVHVEVVSEFVPERSAPHEGTYFFAYHIRITNQADETVQLLSREWLITDGDGQVERIEGEGVVGEQPVLGPGESFEYTSFCPLPTPYGSMHGSYLMAIEGGGTFLVTIPAFALAVSSTVN